MNYLNLLEKLAAGTASPEEKMQWQQWLNTADEAVVRQVMQLWAKHLPEQPAERNGDSELLDSIIRQLPSSAQEDNAALKAVKGNGANSWRWYMAAAALLAVAVTGAFIYRGMNKPASLEIAAVADKAPGGNKAVLTLSDGRRIVLDSTASGSLAADGGVQVVSADAGTLAYQLTDSADNGKAVAFNTLETPRGGQFRLSLPDGTKVWLNSASVIRYPTTAQYANREVSLSGEAYFEVSANRNSPFLVRTANQLVTVLGTEFNVNAYDDEEASRTTLITGSIQVRGEKEGAALTPAKVLKVGQQSVLPYKGAPQLSVATPDIAEIVAWKDGEFRFSNAKITTIMRQIARWYDVEIVYEGTVPQNDFYGVIPRKQYVSQLLKALTLTKNVHFKTIENKIIVMAGPA